jgi:indole-3-glycerol phosphate synthase
MNVLERIVEQTRADLDRRRRSLPQAELEQRLVVRGKDRPFAEALTHPGISVIAEHKRRSPSHGVIREGSTVEEIVGAYERGGAVALSVLTEGPNFGGSLDDLGAARAAATLPILRKDFIVDGYQLVESAVAGADAVLLIVAALEPEELAELQAHARELDLDVLVEIHDEDELDAALDADADIVGINNRNLGDLTVDTQRTLDLLSDVPAGKTVVAESGYSHRDQLEELEEVGVDAVLVGEALMRSPDVETACRLLAGGGADDGPA